MRIVRDRRAQRDAPIANARAIDRYSPRTLTPHWMFITVDIVVVSSCRVVSTTPTTPRDLDHETTSTADRGVWIAMSLFADPKCPSRAIYACVMGAPYNAHIVLVCAN